MSKGICINCGMPILQEETAAIGPKGTSHQHYKKCLNALQAALTASEQERNDALEAMRDARQTAHEAKQARKEAEEQKELLTGWLRAERVRARDAEARAEEVERQLEVMREALEKHHKWHCESGEMGVGKDPEGVWIEVNLSAEYSDSSLCAETMSALSQPSTRSAKLRELVAAAAYYDSVLELDSSGRPVDDYDRDEAALSLRAKYSAYKEQP